VKSQWRGVTDMIQYAVSLSGKRRKKIVHV
jgi:hypothetical protein